MLQDNCADTLFAEHHSKVMANLAFLDSPPAASPVYIPTQAALRWIQQVEPEPSDPAKQLQEPGDVEEHQEGATAIDLTAPLHAASQPDEVSHIEQFMLSVTTTLNQPILPDTPKKISSAQPETEPNSPRTPRSSRLKKKATTGKGSTQLAQDVLAKKLGELSPQKDEASDLFNSFVQRFQRPLTKGEMEAITALVEKGGRQKNARKRQARRIAPLLAEAQATMEA